MKARELQMKLAAAKSARLYAEQQEKLAEQEIINELCSVKVGDIILGSISASGKPCNMVVEEFDLQPQCGAFLFWIAGKKVNKDGSYSNIGAYSQRRLVIE